MFRVGAAAMRGVWIRGDCVFPFLLGKREIANSLFGNVCAIFTFQERLEILNKDMHNALEKQVVDIMNTVSGGGAWPLCTYSLCVHGWCGYYGSMFFYSVLLQCSVTVLFLPRAGKGCARSRACVC